MNNDKPIQQVTSPGFTPPTPNKPKKFKPFGAGFNPVIIIFVVLFATIGAYLIFKSFAATPTATLEVEALTGSGQIIDAQYASGKKALAFKDTSALASGTINFSDVTTDISIKARGDQCRGAPQATILIDGKQVLTASVTDRGWATYTAHLSTPLAAGQHTISAGLTNPLRKGGCTRVLYLDVINALNDSPTPPPNDTTPPTASISSPTNGATVSGTADIKVTASDNVAVTKVEFAIDNGSPIVVTASPYNYSWDTTTVSNGSHTIKATSYDAAGNKSAIATINLTVNNTSTPPPPPANSVRIPAGYSGADFTDQSGNSWKSSSDSSSVYTTSKTYSTANPIAGTSDPKLYNHERAASNTAKTFDYNIPVGNGTYSVKLHFAEIWTPNCAANRRTFNVSSGNQQLLTNYDIFAEVGCESATVKNFTVPVTDGVLNLHFTPGTSGSADPNPKVNSIEIIPSSTGPDTEKPSTPSGLSATSNSGTQVQLNWNSSTDNIGVVKYNIYRNGGSTPVASPTTNNYLDMNGLTQYTDYTYAVEACDGTGNCSDKSAPATVKTKDTNPPTQPTGVTANSTSSSSINVNWSASTDAETGLNGYNVYRNGSKVGSNVASTSFTDNSLAASTTYSYTVEACDKATPANCILSTVVTGTTQVGADTTPPSAPGNFRATVNGATQITLNWNASTDTESPNGITYTVTRNGTPIASNITGLSYANSGLTASTTYQYAVTAKNSANLVSAASTVSATTQAAPDTTAPSVPTNLNGNAISTTQINLTWSASTDAGGSGLAGYNIYRNGTKVNTSLVTSTSYGDSGLSTNTAYSYTVNAVDGTGNSSAQSAPKSITTQNTTTPPVGDCTSFVSPGSLSSVSSAFSALPNGGVLCLRGGTYTGSGVTLSKSGTSSARATIKSAPGETAVMDALGQTIGKTSDILTISGSYVTFSGIEMKNSTGRALRTTGSNILVSNNKIHDIQYNGILDAGTNNVIDGNEVWRTVLSNTNAVLGSSGWAEAINTFGSNNTTIKNNKVYDSWGEGIDYINSNGGVAEGNLVYRNYSVQIYLDGSSNVTVRNNKLGERLNTSGKLMHGVQLSSEGGGVFTGNLVTDNYFYNNNGISTSYAVPSGSTWQLLNNHFGCDANYTNCTRTSNTNN